MWFSLVFLMLASEVCHVFMAPTSNTTLANHKSKHKPLPFEDDFDSEYDYESEEYEYLTLDDIQRALTRRSTAKTSTTTASTVESRRRRSITDKSHPHRHKRQYSTAPTNVPSFNFNEEQQRFNERHPPIQIDRRNCNPLSTTCNRTTVILVLPDDRYNNFGSNNDRLLTDNEQHHNCGKKKCKKHRKHRHRDNNSGSGGSNENLEDSKERKRRIKEMKKNHHSHHHHSQGHLGGLHQHHSGSNDSNDSNGSEKKNKKKHHRHHHHHHHKHHTTTPLGDCLDYLLRRNHRNHERSGESGTSPCQSSGDHPFRNTGHVSSTTSTSTTERSYDIDIRGAFQ